MMSWKKATAAAITLAALAYGGSAMAVVAEPASNSVVAAPINILFQFMILVLLSLMLLRCVVS